jgi:bacteriocin biosynthesis cyclodehydratase domain-containing protein
MRASAFEFCVLGIGHLAAAVRVQLPLFGLAPCEPEEPCGARRVVLACSDYVSTSSFADANRRAVREGCAILFAWISGGRIEVGPLVVPLESPCFECRAARRWDFSLRDATACFAFATPGTALNPDTRLKSVAHFGALLVAREVAGFRFGARDARLIGRVAKFDPPCLYPEIIEIPRVADCPVCGKGRGGFLPAGAPSPHSA